MKNVTLTFTVRTFVEAETVDQFEQKKDELLDDIQVQGLHIVSDVVECGKFQLE